MVCSLPKTFMFQSTKKKLWNMKYWTRCSCVRRFMTKPNHLLHTKCKYVMIIKSIQRLDYKNNVKELFHIPFEWQFELNFHAFKIIETLQLFGRLGVFNEKKYKRFEIGFYYNILVRNTLVLDIEWSLFEKEEKIVWMACERTYLLDIVCKLCVLCCAIGFEMKSCQIQYESPECGKQYDVFVIRQFSIWWFVEKDWMIRTVV